MRPSVSCTRGDPATAIAVAQRFSSTLDIGHWTLGVGHSLAHRNRLSLTTGLLSGAFLKPPALLAVVDAPCQVMLGQNGPK